MSEFSVCKVSCKRPYCGLVSVFCCTVAAWVFVFVSPISSCKTKLGSSIKTSYGGEVAWDSESVAWNYILLKHKTCALTNVTDLGDWGHKRWVQKSSWELSRWYRGFKSLGEFVSLHSKTAHKICEVFAREL